MEVAGPFKERTLQPHVLGLFIHMELKATAPHARAKGMCEST